MKSIVVDVKSRINRAFKELRNDDNLAAKMNFSCCGSCGSSEIYKITREQGNVGYVFYHSQDNEGLLRTGRVLLRFGATSSSGDVTVGRMIVQAIQRAGLDVDWNGDPSRCIEVYRKI